MAVEENKDAVRGALERWNAKDEQYYEIYTDDVVAHGFPPDVPPSIEGIRAMFGSMGSRFPTCTATSSTWSPRRTRPPCTCASPACTRVSSWASHLRESELTSR